MLSRKLTTRLNLTALEDRAVPTTFPTSIGPTSGLASTALINGQLQTAPLTSPITTIQQPAPIVNHLAVGYGDNWGYGYVRLYRTPTQYQEILAYNLPSPLGFQSPLRVAVGDVTGDGVPDVITALGHSSGAPLKIFDGTTLGPANPTSPLPSPTPTRSFFPFGSSFTGGLFVTTGDFDRDGKADLVVSRDGGGTGEVKIYSGADLANPAIPDTALTPMVDFMGIADPNFLGGAYCAAGDLNGDGVPDLAAGAGAGGGPRVAVFDGTSLRRGQTPRGLVHDFYGLSSSGGTGAFVTIDDVNRDGHPDLLVSGITGQPTLAAFSGPALLAAGTPAPLWAQTYGPSSATGGLQVVAKDLDGDGTTDLAFSSANALSITTIPSQSLHADGSYYTFGVGVLDAPGTLPNETIEPGLCVG